MTSPMSIVFNAKILKIYSFKRHYKQHVVMIYYKVKNDRFIEKNMTPFCLL